MSRKKIIAIALVALAAAAAFAGWLRFRGEAVEGVVRVSGNIEVTDVDVSFRIPGRVVERAVDEGMTVSAGQLVARLDDSDLVREAALKGAELQAAVAARRDLEAGSRPQEIARAGAAVAAAQAESDRLSRDFERAKALHEKGAISRQEFERIQAAREVAEERRKEARESLLLVEEGPRKEQVEQARARVRQAEEALLLAKTRLTYAKVVSPLGGTVLSKNVEPGDYVAAGTPVVTVGALSQVWLRAYIEETDLGRVKVGQEVAVTTDTFPGKRYAGRVSFLSPQAEFTPKSVQTRKERVKLVYRIKVDIANPDMELKPGMPADGTIRVDGEARSR